MNNRMFEIITIAFDPVREGFDADALNKFLLNKRVASYKAEFFIHGEKPFWSIFVEYDPVIPPTSAPALAGLDEPQRILLDRLKAWRKQRAEKDGVPPYIVANNRELLEIVTQAPKTLESLKSIKGFGKSKMTKYGEEIIALIKGFHDKPQG